MCVTPWVKDVEALMAAPRARSRGAEVKIESDDPTLTRHAGLLLTGELTRRLQVIETIDEAINRVRRWAAVPRHAGGWARSVPERRHCYGCSNSRTFTMWL
jgi:hypothetical protein